MSSLKKECGNCHRNSVKTYVPVEVPIPDFTKLNKELAYLEQQKSKADAAEAKALDALLTARAKKNRLQKQQKLLKRREQQWMDESRKLVEELEALEAVDEINRDMSSLEEELMPGTLTLDWSAFMPSILKGDSRFNELISASHDTAPVAISNL
jgi:chemotaxis regulatin CheY-phosphate phosphatase CheZ